MGFTAAYVIAKRSAAHVENLNGLRNVTRRGVRIIEQSHQGTSSIDRQYLCDGIKTSCADIPMMKHAPGKPRVRKGGGKSDAVV